VLGKIVAVQVDFPLCRGQSIPGEFLVEVEVCFLGELFEERFE
jgi:hypothetical protein